MSHKAAAAIGVALAAMMPFGCALVFDLDALGPRSDGGVGDATVDDVSTSIPPDDASSIPDTAVSDGRGPTGLSDRIALPDLDASECSAVSRTFNSCGFGNACRFATPDSGRCEDCTPPRCTGNVGTKCVHSYDCDIIYTCFSGICTPDCLLGQIECGAPEDCLSFGYAADNLGLCNPSTVAR